MAKHHRADKPVVQSGTDIDYSSDSARIIHGWWVIRDGELERFFRAYDDALAYAIGEAGQ